MSIDVEATYENGMLKLDKPVPLSEHARVRLTINPVEGFKDPLEGLIGSCDGPPDGAANHDKYIYGELRK
jgi:predicted DNA-binding antitoxin AbrB/MazE fold protein